MALTVGRDRFGDWATMTCDRRGCECHVSLRPAAEGQTGYDLVCAVFDMAQDDGWRLIGRAYCPEHRLERRWGRPRVSDGYPWARLAREGVKGGQRPA